MDEEVVVATSKTVRALVDPDGLEIREEKPRHLSDIARIKACLGLGFLSGELWIDLNLDRGVGAKERIEEMRVEGLERRASPVVHDSVSLALGSEVHKGGWVTIREDIRAEPDGA